MTDKIIAKIEVDKEMIQSAIEQYVKDNPNIVEVVRCKDCKHSYRADNTCRVCQKYHYQKLGDESPTNECADSWFCADGERKEDVT